MQQGFTGKFSAGGLPRKLEKLCDKQSANKLHVPCSKHVSQKKIAAGISILTDPSASHKDSHMDTYEVNFPKIFGALSDPTRLAVVDKLLDGPASVTDLSRPFDMAGPSFLKHLRVLENAGIVASTKSGRVRTVSLVPDSLMQVEHWVRQHRARLGERFDRLGNFLSQEQ